MRITVPDPVYPGRGRPSTSCAINTLTEREPNGLNGFMLEVWNLDHRVGTSPLARLRNIRHKERHWGETLLRRVKETERQFTTTLIFEIEMRNRNRVTLSEHRKDSLGLPLGHVDFKLGERDEATFKAEQKISSFFIHF